MENLLERWISAPFGLRQVAGGGREGTSGSGGRGLRQPLLDPGVPDAYVV